MPVTFTLPLPGEKPASVKDALFTILTTTYPLSLMELLNTLKKQYNIFVSFQSVRKAVLQLVAAKVLVKEGKKFSINREWIIQATNFATKLQREYFGQKQERQVASIGKNVSTYSFTRLLDMDAVWNGIMRDNFASNSEQPKIISFAAVHFWFVIVTLAQETELMKEMINQGIQLYFACYGNTLLDKWTVQQYNNVGVHSKVLSKPKDFINGHNIGTYGDLVIQVTYPEKIAKKIDQFFSRYKRIEDAKLAELTEITLEECELQLTVIRDPLLAKTVRESIIKNF